MARDTIVDEVRQVREQYAAQFGFNLDAIYRDLKERERRGEFRVVHRRPRRPQSGTRVRSGRGRAAASN
jgi:hypothetical protein